MTEHKRRPSIVDVRENSEIFHAITRILEVPLQIVLSGILIFVDCAIEHYDLGAYGFWHSDGCQSLGPTKSPIFVCR